MSETLQISKENAVKAFDQANEKGKQLLSNLFGKKTFLKDVCERIQNWDDILAEHGITQSQFDEQCKGLPEDEIGYKEVKLIVEAYNEGWVPDYDNHHQPKFEPRFIREKGSPSGSGFSYYGFVHWASGSGSAVGSRLVFRDPKILRHAAEHFIDLHKIWAVYSRSQQGK